MSEQDTLVLAGEYVLGLLDGRERVEFEDRLAHDKEMRAHVAQWRHRFDELDAATATLAPSPQLWPAIERAIVAKTPAASARTSFDVWRSLQFWRGAALAAVMGCLLLAIGLVIGNQRPQPVVIAVLESQDSTPGAIVEAYADGSIRLVPLTDIPVPEGRALQVWTLWDRATGPVPLGLLDRARNAVLTVSGQPVPRPQQLYEITLEPAAGSPTGRPTGPILYKGFAAAPR